MVQGRICTESYKANYWLTKAFNILSLPESNYHSFCILVQILITSLTDFEKHLATKAHS
jgi:hypothetical protein